MTSRTQLTCLAGRKSKISRRAYCAAQSHTARASLAGERADTMKTANLQPAYGTESDLETENLNPCTPKPAAAAEIRRDRRAQEALDRCPGRKPGRQMLERLGVHSTLYETFINTARQGFVKIGAPAVGVIEDELDAPVEDLRRDARSKAARRV
jgi:hypothetical protein